MFMVSHPCPTCGEHGFQHIPIPHFRDWVEHGNGVRTATIVYYWNHCDKTLVDCGPFETEYRESVGASGTTITGTRFG
jgi:hypothetical protein